MSWDNFLTDSDNFPPQLTVRFERHLVLLALLHQTFVTVLQTLGARGLVSGALLRLQFQFRHFAHLEVIGEFQFADFLFFAVLVLELQRV